MVQRTSTKNEGFQGVRGEQWCVSKSRNLRQYIIYETTRENKQEPEDQSKFFYGSDWLDLVLWFLTRSCLFHVVVILIKILKTCLFSVDYLLQKTLKLSI